MNEVGYRRLVDALDDLPNVSIQTRPSDDVNVRYVSISFAMDQMLPAYVLNRLDFSHLMEDEKKLDSGSTWDLPQFRVLGIDSGVITLEDMSDFSGFELR